MYKVQKRTVNIIWNLIDRFYLENLSTQKKCRSMYLTAEKWFSSSNFQYTNKAIPHDIKNNILIVFHTVKLRWPVYVTVQRFHVLKKASANPLFSLDAILSKTISESNFFHENWFEMRDEIIAS